MIDVREYHDARDRSPFGRWFSQLSPRAALKVRSALAQIEGGNLGDVKPVGEGVSERRVHWGPGYRILFGQDGENLVILLGGSDKDDQSEAIDRAKECWRDYRKRKKAKE